MDFIIVLFVFLLPLASIVVSAYCLFHILSLKKVASRLSFAKRSSGTDVSYE